MNKKTLTCGVAVITLTSKIYKGSSILTFRSRIGFCGEFNEQILSEMKNKFKELYKEQHKSEFKGADKITCSATVKAMECDMLLNGGK